MPFAFLICASVIFPQGDVPEEAALPFADVLLPEPRAEEEEEEAAVFCANSRAQFCCASASCSCL